MEDKKILFLVNTTWEEIVNKGVPDSILEREEFGYFNHVYSVHFPAFCSQIIKLNTHHTILEFRGKLRNNLLNRCGISFLLLIYKMPFVIWKLKRFIKNNRIDIIRSVDPFHTAILGFILSRLTKKPWCISIHADHDLCFRINHRKDILPLILKIIKRFTLKKAHLVMPISKYLARQAELYGAESNRIRTIPHGIDLMLFNGYPDNNIKKTLKLNNEKLIVFVGRLHKEKYIYDIIHIAKKVIVKRNDVKFIVIGSGTEEKNFKKQIFKEALDNYFIFLGFQPRKMVIEWLKLADVNLCLLGGFSLLEAAASAKPVIAYDVEWHHEVIENNKTGLLVHEGDIEAVTGGIIKLLDDQRFSNEIGNNAKRLVFEKYSLEKASRIKVNCYEELLKRRQILN